MSTEIAPERIARMRRYPCICDVDDLLDALESSRAEVQRLREEARRSDAGRVEWVEASKRLPEPEELVWICVRNKNKEDGIPLYDMCSLDENSQWRKRENTWEDIVWWAYPVSPESRPDAGRVEVPEMVLDALRDARSGWRCIRENHGDMYGIGWDRVEQKLTEAISRLSPSPQPSADVVVVPTEYLAMLESAANRFCSSCRDREGCTMTTRHLGGLGCGAWKLDGARINALRSSTNQDAGEGSAAPQTDRGEG